MIRETLFLLIFVGIISCESKVQSEDDLTPEFNNSHLRSHVEYNHEYDGDRLAKTKETTDLFLNGKIQHSYVSISDFEYSEKGLLIKEAVYDDIGETFSTELYRYNNLDSLVERIQINGESDTIFWEKYHYYPDSKRLTFRRTLGPDINQDITDLTAPISYDLVVLIYERHEYIYSENHCIQQITYSQDGNANKNVHFEYDANGNLTKEIHTQIYGGFELTEKTKHYDYSKSQEFPDFIAFDTTNRRIEELHNEFKGNGTMIETRSYNYGNSITQIIYENGKEVGVLIIEKDPALMVYDRAIYNENGNIKELFNYRKE